MSSNSRSSAPLRAKHVGNSYRPHENPPQIYQSGSKKPKKGRPRRIPYHTGSADLAEEFDDEGLSDSSLELLKHPSTSGKSTPPPRYQSQPSPYDPNPPEPVPRALEMTEPGNDSDPELRPPPASDSSAYGGLSGLGFLAHSPTSHLWSPYIKPGFPALACVKSSEYYSLDEKIRPVRISSESPEYAVSRSCSAHSRPNTLIKHPARTKRQ